MAAGRCKSAATSRGLRPFAESKRASLPHVVVLPDPWKAAEHQDRRPGLLESDRRVDRPHQLDQFVMDDLDDLLLGPDALDQFGPDRPLRDLDHELLNDVIVHVGFEERVADLLEPLFDIGLGQHASRPELPERGPESFLQVVEHGRSAP